MKPKLKKIETEINEAFEVLHVDDAYFFPYWHYHPQYEIMLIKKGNGIQYVGDNIREFNKGDIILLGPNIPHIFRNPPNYFEPQSEHRATASVLYFSNNLIESDFFNLIEMQSIKNLLLLSKRGIKIEKNFLKKTTDKFISCIENTNTKRIINFLLLLEFIATETGFTVLASEGFIQNVFDKNIDRLNKVFDYLLNNYQNEISLPVVAEIANMSPTAFCRFFKNHTNSTLISYLNEIRIGQASKLLIENEDMNVTEISFECGFNNLTNFTIQFKKMKGCSPTSYRKKYLQMNF